MERINALFELTRAVNAATSLEEVFDCALNGLSRTLGLDRSAVLLFDADGVLRFKASRGLSEIYCARVEGHSPWPRETVDPPPLLIEDVRNAPTLAGLQQAIEEEGIGSLGFIPLVHNGILLGKFMVYFKRPHVFRDDEVAFSGAVANLIATVVERDMREAALRSLHAEAERVRECMRFLSDASRMLAASLESVATAATLADLCVPFLADYVVVYVDDEDGRIARAACAHRDPSKKQLLDELEARYPVNPDAPTPLMRTLEKRVSELSPVIPSGFAARMAKDSRHLEILESLDTRQYILVPLVARGRTLGAIMLASAESGRLYTEQDVSFAEELATRAAVAIDNARLYREAKNASKAKDEFLATLSHELRTPMTAILGWASMLRLGQLDATTFQVAVDTIERSARTQARIVEDILDVSKIVSGKFAAEKLPLDLTAITRDAADGMRPEASAKGIDLTIHAEGPMILTGDAARLKQVVWNLLSNALKFSSRGDRVSVTVARSGPHAEITVQDTGAGITPELLPLVFERFQQGDPSMTRSHGGLGLGLAIVRHIADVHGGSVQAFSDGPGKGATFVVRLPLLAGVNEVEHPSDGDGAPITLPQLDGCRVLIVDDEHDARLLLESILGQCGATTMSVANVAAALDAFDTWEADVVLSDIAMPGEDGYSLIARLRARGTLVPAIAVSAFARQDDRERMLASGYHAFLSKPVDPLELAQTVSRAITRPA